MNIQLSKQSLKIASLWGIMMLLSLACGLNPAQSTAIPANRPINFEVQTASPTPNLAEVTATLTPNPQNQPLPLSDVPTDTPTAGIPPTQTPLKLEDMPILTETVTPEATTFQNTEQATAIPTQNTEQSNEITATQNTEQSTEITTTEKATVIPKFTGELDPPLKGGDWDFETEFVLWENPYGDCSGALVSSGWMAFVQEGEYGSSCMGQNLFPADVQSGGKSQEITFDFIAASSGIYRAIATKPNHRYQIEAYGKHVRSLAPVQLFLGVDTTGGTIWDATTVQWFPWIDPAEDVWTKSEQTVTATGETMTIFIRGFHPQGDQGGKTYIDNVSVTHLGE